MSDFYPEEMDEEEAQYEQRWKNQRKALKDRLAKDGDFSLDEEEEDDLP